MTSLFCAVDIMLTFLVGIIIQSNVRIKLLSVFFYNAASLGSFDVECN